MLEGKLGWLVADGERWTSGCCELPAGSERCWWVVLVGVGECGCAGLVYGRCWEGVLRESDEDRALLTFVISFLLLRVFP